MRTCKHCDTPLPPERKNLACQVCKNGLERYGLDRKAQLLLLETQQNCCALCEEPVELHTGNNFSGCVDHDHQTGKVRGILCGHCNVALGKLEKKNLSKFIQNVKDYI